MFPSYPKILGNRNMFPCYSKVFGERGHLPVFLKSFLGNRNSSPSSSKVFGGNFGEHLENRCAINWCQNFEVTSSQRLQHSHACFFCMTKTHMKDTLAKKIRIQNNFFKTWKPITKSKIISMQCLN